MLRLLRGSAAFLVSGALPVLTPLVVLIFCALSALPAWSAPTRRLTTLDWPLARMGAPTAWAAGADGHGVSVLVIDTGLDATMRDTVLAGHVLPSYAAPLHTQVTTPCDTTDPALPATCPTRTVLVPNPSPYVDQIGHGSFVACEIACQGTQYHIYGIAPGAKIAVARVFAGADGADGADIAAAIRWGAIHRFPLISMSLGSSSEDTAITAAVRFAQKMGTLIVAASGNDGHADGISYPAALPGVISVGSSTRWDSHASYSNAGAGLSISAPGDFVFSIAPMHPTLIGCGGLCQWEGTSMATPYVAGALADLMSLGLSGAQARAALLHGAYRWPGMDPTRFGAGVVSLPRALTYAKIHFGR